MGSAQSSPTDSDINVDVDMIDTTNNPLLSDTYNLILDTKVIMYSKPYMEGEAFTIDVGNYTSLTLMPQISPNNVFSLSVPPDTAVELFCGDIYDFGGKGSLYIGN